jgi:hypothetical protein
MMADQCRSRRGVQEGPKAPTIRIQDVRQNRLEVPAIEGSFGMRSVDII